MTTNLKLAFALALIAGAGLALPAAARDSTRTSVDWEGRYVGTVPCGSCPGIETMLTINEAGFYTLREVYQDDSNTVFEAEGEFSWDDAGSAIRIPDGDQTRVFVIGEGAAWMVDAEGRPQDDYELTQQMEFNGGGQQLFIDPRSVKDDAGKVTFDALVNFEHQAEGGHRSFMAEMVIDCARGAVDMPTVTYFTAVDAGGKVLHATEDNAGNWLEIPTGSDDVFGQARETLCR